MATQYEITSQNPSEFLSMTSYTLQEFGLPTLSGTKMVGWAGLRSACPSLAIRDLVGSRGGHPSPC